MDVDEFVAGALEGDACGGLEDALVGCGEDDAVDFF